MTRSSNHPDADYTPSDMGPPQEVHYTWDDFADEETNEQIMSERKVF